VSVTFSYALFSPLFTYDDLAMQVFIWLHMVQFAAAYANLK